MKSVWSAIETDCKATHPRRPPERDVARLRVLEAAVKRAFRAFGLEIQRLRGAGTQEAVIRNLLRRLPPVAVLDVGANKGQYAAALRYLGYRGVIISFEALTHIHAELSKRARGDPKWLVAPCAALGSEAQRAEINVASNTSSSSLLPMLEVHAQAAPRSVYVGKESVEIVRLDQAFETLIPPAGSLFLKVDTQGYEREVLKGSTALMPRIAVIQVELSLVPLYATAPTLAEMVPYVESLGYEMFNIVPGFKEPRTGRLLQVDGFFVRRACSL